MPYDVIKDGGEKPYKVVKQATKEVLGSHKTRAGAVNQMRAIYANEGKPKHSPGMQYGGKMVLDDSYMPQPLTEGYVDGKKVNLIPKAVEEAKADPVEEPSAPKPEEAAPLGAGILDLLRARKKKD